MTEQEWRTLPEFTLYEITSDGDVRHRYTKKQLKESQNKKTGAWFYTLWKRDGKKTSRNFQSLIESAYPRSESENSMTEAPIAPYLTNLPDRVPRNKTHESLGQAKKAVLYRVQGDELKVPATVYQWQDKKGWQTLWKIEAGTKRKDLPWM